MADTVQLKKAISTRKAMEEYQDAVYLKLIKQLNENCEAIMKGDLGNQFVQNCGRDIASEVVRNCFQTSDYYITVDQLARRILEFSYDNEYDPLAENGGAGEINKNVYNYNELKSDRLNQISDIMANSQKKLFEEDRMSDSLDKKGRDDYKESRRDADGKLYDSLTGQEEKKHTYIKNGKSYQATDMQVDHVQSRAGATYNSRYVTEKGRQALKEFWNSSDNFEMMQQVANQVKSDVRVYEVTIDGKKETRYYATDKKDTKQMAIDKEMAKREGKTFEAVDITYKSTPQQMADAVIYKLENVDREREGENEKRIQELKDKGYLDENGKVPKDIRRKLTEKYRNSMNVESETILKNTDYKKVASDARDKVSIGKIIAGQVVYYTAPPLIYELRVIVKEKDIRLENALEKLGEAAKRIGEYVISKLKTIFTNIAFNSLKNFIKSFMDILINTVKATVKKLLKMAKNLALATVDAIRIIGNKNATSSEKADSVMTLFGVTITSCVVELLFEMASDALHIPDPFDDIIFGPLQILTTIICTNLTMLILKKADLFGVQYGFKMSQIRQLFKETEREFDIEAEAAMNVADFEIQRIIDQARIECREIYNNLEEIDYKTQSIRPELEKINQMFSMHINFEDDWLRFIGVKAAYSEVYK